MTVISKRISSLYVISNHKLFFIYFLFMSWWGRGESEWGSGSQKMSRPPQSPLCNLSQTHICQQKIFFMLNMFTFYIQMQNHHSSTSKGIIFSILYFPSSCLCLVLASTGLSVEIFWNVSIMGTLQEGKGLCLLTPLVCHVQLCSHFYFEVASVPEIANPNDRSRGTGWLGPLVTLKET